MKTSSMNFFSKTALLLKEHKYTVLESESTDSTQLDIKRHSHLLSKNTPLAAISKQQLAGRGRGNHTWIDDKSNGQLFLSLAWQLNTPPQPILTALFGLSLFKALETLKPQHFSLKPPNDLYCNEKKLAGLLTEVLSTGNSYNLILGIGLNVLTSPKQYEFNSTSLKQELNGFGPKQWDTFVIALMSHLQKTIHLNPQILTKNQQNELKESIAKTSKYHQIKSVSCNGDLILSDKTIPWHSL